jgi:hypothetical protein
MLIWGPLSSELIGCHERNMRVQSSLLLVVLLALETHLPVALCRKKGGECHESLCSEQVASAFLWRVGGCGRASDKWGVCCVCVYVCVSYYPSVRPSVHPSVCLSQCSQEPAFCIRLVRAWVFTCQLACAYIHTRMFLRTLSCFCVHRCLRFCLSRPL